MVKMRKRKYAATYEQQAMVDLESAAVDAVRELDIECARQYRVQRYVGQVLNVAVWDMVSFGINGSVELPVPTPQNAGKRVAISAETGVTSAVARVASGTINGATSYTLSTANRVREFISNGSGWVSHD